MEPLFKNSQVIKLNDKDFRISQTETGHTQVKLVNDQFKNKDGYLMIYASWCPHCRAKEDFWSYLGEQFNSNPTFKKEGFRIGVVDSENPQAVNVLQALQVGPIPRFMHVIPDRKNFGHGNLVDYQGHDLTPESLIGEICDMSPGDTLCHFDPKVLNPPPISYN
jgi:thiol-disulfide isomerase/thioredoxin